MAGQEKAVPSSPEGVSEESEVVLGKRKTYPKKSLQQLGSPVELPQEVLVEFHLDTPPFDQQHATSHQTKATFCLFPMQALNWQTVLCTQSCAAPSEMPVSEAISS